MSHSAQCQSAPVLPAVAANPPVHTGPAPATAGASSLTATEADAAGLRGKHLPHSAVSCHGPTGAMCRFCSKSLSVFNQSEPCPDRARIEHNTRLISEIHNMEAALRGLLEAMPAPATRKLTAAWDNALAILARIDGRA